MKKITLTLLLAFEALMLNAQTPTFNWAKGFGGSWNLHNSAIVAKGIREDNTEEILTTKLYPNPANENTILELNANSDFATITITDVMGKEKEKLQVELLKDDINAITISTKDLTPGLYFLNIKNGEQAQTLRLVVNR